MIHTTLESYKKWCKEQRKIVGTQEWIDSEIRATIQHALGQKDNDIDSAVLQVTCLRLAYNLDHGKCIASILRSIIETTCCKSFKNMEECKKTLPKVVKELNTKLKSWSPYLIKISKGDNAENVTITEYLETYCRYRFFGNSKIYNYFLPYILHQLYMNDIIEEEGLYIWRDATEESISDSSSSGGSAEEIMIQIKQAMAALDATAKFFNWLDTASSESSESSD